MEQNRVDNYLTFSLLRHCNEDSKLLVAIGLMFVIDGIQHMKMGDGDKGGLGPRRLDILKEKR